MMQVKGKKIFVGLSGGVDSAVSAALLKEAGAIVTGVFIKGWYPPGMPCTWAEERRDAMRVAAKIHIPFRTLDASAEYKKWVIDYLLAEYHAGRTPNPDIMCNKEIKFGAFYRYAMSEGADAIATGHYCSGEKDQRYFLWAVPKEILQTTIFPVGNYEKEKVRALARARDLPVAQKKDSQGICFLGSISVKEFLKKECGTDNPALLYTLGQRVSSKNDGPYYVVGKDVEKKEIIISKTRASDERVIRFTHANWHTDPWQGNLTSMPATLEAQYRYRGPYVSGHIVTTIPKDSPSSSTKGSPSGSFQLDADTHLPEPPAPGQSIVFYDKDRNLVGGGIII